MQANYLDGVPLVANGAERDAKFPAPERHQRVHNLSTGQVEMWDGRHWVTAMCGSLPDGPLIHATDGTVKGSSFTLDDDKVLGTNVRVTSDNTSRSYIGSHTHAKQSVATKGSIQGAEAYTHTDNPSGQVTLAIGVVGNIEHSGAGTLATAAASASGVILTGSGTITTARAFDTSGGNKKIGRGASGTIGTYIGYACGDLSTTGATTNYACDFTNVMRADYSSAAGDTRLLLWDVSAGTLKRVSIGAADSGGAGFKVLRVPN